ncbi:DEP domain-containing protein DDB_G0279099-like isoform X2 [Anneissia japonica]|uniref:DEP domain-containing protein DDB_G0279099-like isoform X2 n=1 Tax=Anneissia japonica TaxID=1529436 RepID=UPI0014255EFC|nr:DEP domain-containing protein DDB_G0279099-like isoform X2 [Anneissia japonica]
MLDYLWSFLVSVHNVYIIFRYWAQVYVVSSRNCRPSSNVPYIKINSVSPSGWAVLKQSNSNIQSISNVALQNSEKLSTATNRSRKSFMSDLLVLNEANQQNVDSSKTNETEKPSTSQTLLPTSNNSSPEDNSTWDEMTNQTPDKQKEQNSKMSRTKTVAFEEPLKNKKNDSSMISKNMRDENENDEETNLATGSTNSTASLQKVQCISNGDST